MIQPNSSRRRRALRRCVAIAMLAPALLAACGDDDEPDSETDSMATTEMDATSTERDAMSTEMDPMGTEMDAMTTEMASGTGG